MSAPPEVTAKRAAGAPLGFFERFLTAWVALCIVIGIALGQFMPGVFQAIGAMEVARVNLPVGILIWVMIIPMLLKIDFGALHQVKGHLKGIGVTLAINWLVKPFSMAFLAWLFIRHLFAPLLPAEQVDSYIAGLILLAAAPCTAMVFVWSRLTNGDPYFTLTQVALNDVIMIFAFAPVVGFLLGVASITVPWATLFTSVVLYIVIPVILAQAIRRRLLSRGQEAFDAAMARIQPWSVAALLLTLVLLFAFQGNAILRQPLVIALLAVPILVQVFFNSSLAYLLNRALGEKHSVACPSALIGASNFFELAVAAAISLFGFESGAALATVVGVLIEVPVMLLVVRVANGSKGWYEAGLKPSVAPYGRETWNKRFAIEDYLFGREPSEYLRSRSSHLPAAGRALCVADGEGRNSVYLARQGMRVDAFDISDVGVAKARKLAAQANVSIDYSVADCDGWHWPADTYDAVVAIFVQFADPAMRGRLFANMIRCLKSGGVVVLLGYPPKQLEYGTGGPSDLSHLYTAELLRVAFAPLQIIELTEYEAELSEGTRHQGRSALIGLVARKP